jgi:hypothetical protein
MLACKRNVRIAAAVATAVALLAAAAFGVEPQRISASEAGSHVGEIAEVCGHVASSAHIAAVSGQPTFLNFERPYPDQPFSVVIWGSAREKFDTRPERVFDGKDICVTGEIEVYDGVPQIVVDDPAQIVLVNPPDAGTPLTETEGVLIKALLASLGYDVDYGSGEWNEDAVEATRAFQDDRGLSTTGEPDAATLRALAKALPSIKAEDRDLVIRLILFVMAQRSE